MKKYNIELIQGQIVLTYKDENLTLLYRAGQDFIRIDDLNGRCIQGVKPMQNIGEWQVYIVHNYDFLLHKVKTMNVNNDTAI